MTARMWPLVLGGFALGLDAYVLAGLLPEMAADLHTTQAMAGLGVAVFTVAYAVSAPVLAGVAARRSTQLALLTGLGLFTLGNLVTAFTPTLVGLLLARLCAGIGAGLYSPLASAGAVAMVDTSQRGQALSLVLAGLSVGTALGVPCGLFIAAHWGWRWTIGLLVGLGIVAAYGVANHPVPFPKITTVPLRNRFSVLAKPFIRRTLNVTLWTGAASLGLYTYLAEVLTARGMDNHTNVFIWMWGLGGMVGALFIGKIIDQYLHAAQATAIVLIVLGAGITLVGYAPVLWTGMGCFLWGLCGWASVAPQQHALVSYASEHAATAVAWNASANYLGSGLGAACAALALHLGLSANHLPDLALLAVCIAFVLHKMKM